MVLCLLMRAEEVMPDEHQHSPVAQHSPHQVVDPVSGMTGRYTCPMHPEIVRDEPGFCPICGMALEPRQGTGDEMNPELADMTRRFWVSVVLTAPILALMVSEMLPAKPLQRLLGPAALLWVQFAF